MPSVQLMEGNTYNLGEPMFWVQVRTEVLTELVDYIVLSSGDHVTEILTTDEMMTVLFNQYQDMLLKSSEVEITMEVL